MVTWITVLAYLLVRLWELTLASKTPFMFQKDYLLRQIEQLSKAITRILNKKDEGDMEGALEDLMHQYDQAIALNTDKLDRYTPEELIRWLEDEKGLSAQELEALSRLVETEGMILEEQEEYEKAERRFEVVLALLQQAAAQDNATFSLERQQKIAMVRKKLGY